MSPEMNSTEKKNMQNDPNSTIMRPAAKSPATAAKPVNAPPHVARMETNKQTEKAVEKAIAETKPAAAPAKAEAKPAASVATPAKKEEKKDAKEEKKSSTNKPAKKKGKKAAWSSIKSAVIFWIWLLNQHRTVNVHRKRRS
jgi:hypothetical protein